MSDEFAVMEWETDGGFSPQVAESRYCRVCGDTRGPALLDDQGRICLAHLPKIGERRSFR